ncbi:unnamed protein product [Symbiodinium natans]|uniref:Uncharacterized protein n=1 Tax=Symbiodinium natans TaxID=878477 RepID=A0A812LLK8_9DINO|nr:unnamed protein product [Symbiodinium natans]
MQPFWSSDFFRRPFLWSRCLQLGGRRCPSKAAAEAHSAHEWPHEDAELALHAAKDNTSACEARLKAASEAVCNTKAALSLRLKEQKDGDEGIVKVRADKELLESTRAECYEKLKSGSVVGKEAKPLLKKLELIIKQTSADASLITAAPTTLVKPPQERGGFDQIVLEQLEANFAAKLAEFEAQLAVAAPSAAERAAEVQKAEDGHQAAESKQKEVSVELCALKEAQKEAAAAVAAAKKAAADYKVEYQTATQTRDAKKAELETYVDESLATFKELKDRISAKKRRELAKAAEEAAAKAASAEAPPEAEQVEA